MFAMFSYAFALFVCFALVWTEQMKSTTAQQRVSQRPRVFYRRETELIPLVVSRP